MMDEKDVYTFIMEKNEKFMLEEDKKMEKIFGNLTDEQLKYLSELRYIFFRLGFQSSNNSIWVIKNIMLCFVILYYLFNILTFFYK